MYSYYLVLLPHVILIVYVDYYFELTLMTHH